MSLPTNQQFPYNFIFEQSQHPNVNLQQLFPSTQPMLYQIPQEFQTNQNPQLNQPNIIEILQKTKKKLQKLLDIYRFFKI